LVTPIFILNLKNAIIKSDTFVYIFIKYYFHSSHFFIVFPKVQFTIIICGLVFIYVCFTLFSSSISISQQFIIFILIALFSYFAVFTNFILISCFFLFSIFHFIRKTIYILWSVWNQSSNQECHFCATSGTNAFENLFVEQRNYEVPGARNNEADVLILKLF
jgi:hypothetical protein